MKPEENRHEEMHVGVVLQAAAHETGDTVQPVGGLKPIAVVPAVEESLGDGGDVDVLRYK